VPAPLAIELSDVSRIHGTGARAFASLSGVSLAIAVGEFVSIVGPSGSGKSTLLHVMAGLDAPTRGEARILGQSLRGLSDRALSRLRRCEIGFVFQSFNLFPALTAAENVAWPLELAGMRRSAIRDAVAAALVAVEMDVRGDAFPGDLSGGEQQRLAIARAIVHRPSILLADEPTGNLDSETGGRILDLLVELNASRRVTVVMVTHMTAATARGDRTIELRDGHVIADATTSRRAGCRAGGLEDACG